MDRAAWLKEMRRDCEKKYTGWAPLYVEKWGLYDNTTHLQFIEELFSLLPQGSTILDAACGAGRYLPYLLEKNHAVIAIDQSQGMLARAQEIYPQVHFEKIGLQEMTFREVFDGAICMDAIENVSPEDWLGVLRNFNRALKPQGVLYFTAETIEMGDENKIKQAYEKALRDGLPVVLGESLDEGVYHYHPPNRQVREWVQQAGFEILEEGAGVLWYYHFLIRKVAA